MVFSSILFLFFFLPVFLSCYFILPKQFRNLALVVFSLLFYAWGEPIYIGIMIFSTIFDYSIGRIMGYFDHNDKIRKVVLIFSIFGNLSILSFFKYTDFFITSSNSIFGSSIELLEIALPIGISFYTFQTMSYTIDLYRRKVDVQKNIISFAAYVTMFPQLIAGPIVTYDKVEKELSSRKVTLTLFGEGCIRFIEGLGKKVLIANNIGLLSTQIFSSETTELTIITAWIGIIAFGLQIYFDFSGYSDMAIGLGKMLGFHFPENFRYPYISKNVTEFWRRWHITLGSWFREYVYIPLGGNRVSAIKWYRNIFIVWFLTGFWHGAAWNFIMWGLYFGFFLVLEKQFLLKVLAKVPAFLSHFYLLLIVSIGWVLFSFESVDSMFQYIGTMFGIHSVKMFDTKTLYYLSNYYLVFIIAIVFATPLLANVKHKINGFVMYVFYVMVLLLCTAYLVDSTFNPFLYFRF